MRCLAAVLVSLAAVACGSPDPEPARYDPVPTPGAATACADLDGRLAERAKGCDGGAPAPLDCSALIWWNAERWPDCLNGVEALGCADVAAGRDAVPACVEALRAP